MKLQKKVLKEELGKKTDRVIDLEKELEKLTGKFSELEIEIKDKETKGVDLYHENTSQHQKIEQLQYQLEEEVSISVTN